MESDDEEMQVRSVRKFKKQGYKDFVLALDLGGTNLRLGLFGVNDEVEFLMRAETASDESKPLVHSINDFLSEVHKGYDVQVARCVAGIAGPVSEDKKSVNLTNLKMTVRSELVLRESLLKEFFMINDMEAIALGLGLLKPEDLLQLEMQGIGRVKPAPGGTKAIIAAGTGLGESMLVWTGSHYRPVSSEGGHSLLATPTEEQERILEFMEAEGLCRAMPDYEDAVSGRGLAHIYKYYAKKIPEEEHIAKEMAKADDISPIISKYGQGGKSKPCEKALQMFMTFYAQECHNLALKANATGGVYIAGNIAMKNLKMFKDFMKAFLQPKLPDHPLQDLIKNVPVFVIKDPDVNLYGAAVAAAYPERII